MNLRHLALSFLLGGVLAGGVTWWLARGRGEADAGDALTRPPAAEAGAPSPAAPATAPGEPGAAALTGSPRALEHVEELEARNRVLEAEVEALKARVLELAPPPRDPEAFRFGLPQDTPVFNKAAWATLAGHATSLSDKLKTLKSSVVAGEEIPPKVLSDIVKDNMPLAEFAVAFGAEVADPNPNGAYTHPAVVANMMRAALQAAGDPLSREQEIAIKTLGDAWDTEASRAVAATPATAPALARVVVEVDAKLRFLASAKNVLTDAQRAVLFHPETEGRLKLDLLSPALVYMLSFPVEAKAPADLARLVVTRLLSQAGVEREDVSGYEWVGRQWVAEIGAAIGPYRPRDADLVFPHVDQIQARARAQVSATERILGMGGLTPEEVEKLRAVRALLYPYLL